eukprot:6354923-Amphidinium_carterae.1
MAARSFMQACWESPLPCCIYLRPCNWMSSPLPRPAESATAAGRGIGAPPDSGDQPRPPGLRRPANVHRRGPKMFRYLGHEVWVHSC